MSTKLNVKTSHFCFDSERSNEWFTPMSYAMTDDGPSINAKIKNMYFQIIVLPCFDRLICKNNEE